MPGAVRRCTRILWPVKVSEKTPRRVIPPSLSARNIAKHLKKKEYQKVPLHKSSLPSSVNPDGGGRGAPLLMNITEFLRLIISAGKRMGESLSQFLSYV
jgi:hypothetical protein